MNIRFVIGIFVSMTMGLRGRGFGLYKGIHMKSKYVSTLEAYTSLVPTPASPPNPDGRRPVGFGSNTFKVELPEFVRTKKTKNQKVIPTYVPRGANQQKYVDYLTNPDTSIVFGIGPAGCGKTLFACCSAIQSFKTGNITKIILTRPAVSVEEDLGFLPGDILRKMDPWLQPLFDVFLEHYTQSELDTMIERGVIEIAPLGYMRGRTFKNVFILADEMQNSSPMQMKMLLTRIGDGSKMVVTGDLNQSDWNFKNSRGSSGLKGVLNGLADFMGKFSRDSDTDIDDIGLVEMTANDVERSQVVRRILKIYEGPVDPKQSSQGLYGDAALIPLYDQIKINKDL